MKRLSLVFSLLIIFIPLGVFASEYTLNELWGLALKRSERIKIAEEGIYISKKEKDRAVAVLWPALSAFGSHTRYSEEKSRDGLILQPGYSSSWGLRLNQSFSLGGRELIAYSIAKDSIRKNIHDLDSVRENYLMEVTIAYFELLKAKKAVEIAKANVERLTKHRDATKKRLEVGEVTKTALLRAEAELAGANADILRARNNRHLSKAILQRLVGLEKDFDIKEKDFPVALEPLIKDCQVTPLDCLKERALSERPEMMTMDIQREIAEKEIRYTKGSYWPNLAIEVVYLREENEPSPTFSLDERVYGILRFDFPFFEGGLRRAEVSQAKARLRQAEYSFFDLRKAITIEVEESYLNYLTVSGILESLRAEAEYALDNFNAVSKQFEFGLADSLDVIDANTLLVTAERKLANAGYDYQFSFLRLKHAVGLLLETVNEYE